MSFGTDLKGTRSMLSHQIVLDIYRRGTLDTNLSLLRMLPQKRHEICLHHMRCNSLGQRLADTHWKGKQCMMSNLLAAEICRLDNWDTRSPLWPLPQPSYHGTCLCRIRCMLLCRFAAGIGAQDIACTPGFL